MLDVLINKKLNKFTLEADFSVDSGCLGILGASGCGKSMTLKAIAGIVTPDSGRISIAGEKERVLYDSSKRINLSPQLRRVGYLFQNYALFPNMNVEQNIAVGLTSKYSDNEKRNVDEIVRKMIGIFRLEGYEKHYPLQLSGGQQQRVALARIIAYNPEVFLLDEPFSAMDSFLKEGLRLEMIKILKEEFGGISVMVTHDRDEAYQMCDNVILMDEGKIIQRGNTKTVFAKPATVTAARLTGCKNIVQCVKTSEHSVMIPSWNGVEICTSDIVPDGTEYIGIRAHSFIPFDTKEQSTNMIEVIGATISELPFENYIVLEGGIWWKTEKRLHKEGIVTLPKYLYISPEDVLVL